MLRTISRRAMAWLVFLLRSFQADQCLLRAAALTYTTALSIVPFLAVAFSISKGFGFQNSKYMQTFLLEMSAGRHQVVEHITDYINRTDVGTLGALGVAILLITVFTLLGTIERTLNTIWGVRSQRSFSRKFADYLSVTLVCPLLVIVAISFTASMQSFELVQAILSVSVFSSVYVFLLKLLPFFFVALALFFMYKFMPNTRVSWKSCLSGALVAGVIWQLVQKTFLTYQIGVSKYNAIYGSFAQVPLFLIWVYISWIIVLFGAEVGFCLENAGSGPKEGRLGKFSLELKERLALSLVVILTGRFLGRGGPVGVRELAEHQEIPVKLVNQLMFVVSSLGYAAKTESGEDEGYTLSVSPQKATCLEFLRDFRAYQDERVGIECSASVYAGVDHFFRGLEESAAQSVWNINLAELTQATQEAAESSHETAGAPEIKQSSYRPGREQGTESEGIRSDESEVEERDAH